VLRFATGWSSQVDAVFERALGTLKAQGATLVDIQEFEDRSRIGREEFTVLLTELKAGLNAYLATTPPAVKTRTLADVIAFNKANADASWRSSGGDLRKGGGHQGLDDPDYKAARALSFQMAGPGGIDRMLTRTMLSRSCFPRTSRRGRFDAVNGDQISGGGAGGLAAVAGYPHLTVPMARSNSCPSPVVRRAGVERGAAAGAGLRLRAGGEDHVDAGLLPSVEDAPDIAKYLKPIR